MSNYAAEKSATRRSFVTPYIAVWAVLAAGAIGYIGWIATHSELIARTEPGSASPQGESNEGQRAMSDALAEMKALKDTVGEVQRDVTQLKSDMSSTVERNTQLVSRVAALETKPGKPTATAAISPPAQSAPTAAAPAAKSAEAKPAPATPKVINAAPEEAKKALETGSVATAALAASAERAPIVFGPAVVKPAAKPVGIQIATGPSVDAIRLSWSLLSDRHADTLKKLEPRVVSGKDADGETFDLVAGPIKSSAEAKKVCAALEAKSVPCRIGDFKGEAL